jgi:hypothetical protein
MGATVVSGSPSASNWASQKPKDYKNMDLDKALKAYEAANKDIPLPASAPTIPTHQTVSMKAVDTCVKEMEADIKVFKNTTSILKEMISALAAVESAAGKVSGELDKLAKDKTGDDKKKYQSAATSARAIGDQAGVQKKRIEG